MITVSPIAGAIGAELSGVDLARLDDAVVAEVRTAWLEHRWCSSGTRSSPPSSSSPSPGPSARSTRYPFVPGIEEQPDIIAVTKLPHEQVNFGGIWHSDTAYLDEPPMATMLLPARCRP